jgi:capsular exopolysaccharide synthesis family protein
LNEQVRFYKEFKNLLSTEIERLDTDARTLNNRSLDLDRFRIDTQLAETGVERVLGAIDKLTVELPDPPRVIPLNSENPVIVVAPDEKSRKLKMAGIGSIGALGLVLFLIAWLEFRSQRIDSFDQVGRGLGLRLMGTLPAPRRFASRSFRLNTSANTQWQALLGESVNAVRTLLLQALRSDGLRVVMITSATSGEGKTSLATHLAASLARAGHKTLLFDGDLRNPEVHKRFDLPVGPGFSEVLRGEVGLAEAIQPTAVKELSLLSAGEYDGATIELLARDGVRDLLHRLKQEYEFIILDTSPVLPVADTLLLAQHVDGVLLSLFYEVSCLPPIYAAYQKLSMLGVRILGAVINGTHHSTYGYGRNYLPNKEN